jgi:hypothetical protein
MTADVDATTAIERGTITDDAYRASLVALLGAHAIPVWGFGQREAYGELVMTGPSLDHWVRTGGLWAEQERDLWEWEQLVAGVTDQGPADIVRAAVGELADRVAGELVEWIDLALLAVCLDGLGEELVRTLVSSSYGPLRRHASVMVTYKRGQCADGCTGLSDVVRLRQLDLHHVRARAEVWTALTRDAAAAVADAERGAGWVERAIAAPLDVEGALHRSLGRLTARLEEAR